MLTTIPFGKRKIAILGDMLELGKRTSEAHFDIGSQVAGKADILIVAGLRSKDIAKGAREAGMEAKNIIECENSVLAGSEMQKILSEGDVILIKGSQGMRMEKTVMMLMATPTDAPKLLVRQEKEWTKKKGAK